MMRDYPLISEIEEFNIALSEKNTEEILRLISLHPLKYFYNLKLEDHYGLTLFHIIILMDLTQMFHKVIQAIKQRFIEQSKNKNGAASPLINTNSNHK